MSEGFEDVIAAGSIRSLLQPLVSIKRKAVIGYEALSRGVSPLSGRVVPPGELFAWAKAAGQGVELDRLCREKAFARFLPEHRANKDLILSINLNSEVLDQGVLGSGHLLNQAKRWGIHPNNVLIEIIESEVEDTGALLSFIRTYREHGFLIALDDVGTGYSNLERLAMMRPDVIKIDRSLITGIHRQFTKKEVVRSLVALGAQIGSLVVGEGVEQEDETAALLAMGVDVFQGFYFARPFAREETPDQWRPRLMRLAERFKEETVRMISERKQRHAAYEAMVAALVGELTQLGAGEFDPLLADFVARNEEAECVYVLDENGVQVSNTVCNPLAIPENRRFIYQPAEKGADHSLKRFFLPLQAGLDKYTTEPYISLASGNLCTTISSRFPNATGNTFILCLDIGHAGGRGLPACTPE